MASTLGKEFFRLFLFGFIVGFFVTYVAVSYHDKPVSMDFDIDMTDKHHLGYVAGLNFSVYTKVKVLCLVMSTPTTINTYGKSVKETWGKRCNRLLIIEQFGLFTAWQYVLNYHMNDTDWFLRINDDNFVILENLRKFLSRRNPDEPHYFGRRLKGGYCQGNAGYVLSRETLRRFGSLLRDPRKCTIRGEKNPDMAVGRCLAGGEIYPSDTRDARGRQMFHPVSPGKILVPNILKQDFWLKNDDYYPFKEGPECCSDNSITYRVLSPLSMYVMEYFVYHLMPYMRVPMGVSKSQLTTNFSAKSQLTTNQS